MIARAQDLEKLLDITALLTSSLDLDAVLTEVLKNAESLMQAAASNVMLLDAAAGELVYEVVLGSAQKQIRERKRLKVGVGIAGWVAQHRQPLRIADAYQDPRFFSDFDKMTGFRTKSVLCLPLVARDQLIGIAQIMNKNDGGYFTAEDQNLFVRYCYIASIAIDNALLHKRALAQDRLQRDMQLAEEIQRASLPSEVPSIKNLHVEYRSVACRYVAGDVLDITRLEDGRLAVLVADVSGKGVPAALFAAKFSADFEYLIRGRGHGASLFTLLNSMVGKRSTRGMFITAVYAVIDPLTGSVELVNAGHLAPLIVGPKKGSVRPVRTPDFLPLGVLDDFIYQSASFRLLPGERLVLMTDGVYDAKARDGARLGEAAAQKALSDCPALALPRLMKEITRFVSGQAVADDITVVGVGFGDYEERTFLSTTESLPEARRFLEECGLARGFDEKKVGRIALALTEAVANVIKHTNARDPSGEIRIGIGRSAEQLSIHIRDWGAKQDARNFKSRALDDIRPGGLGLHYIRETMDLVEFDDSLWNGNELHLLINESRGATT